MLKKAAPKGRNRHTQKLRFPAGPTDVCSPTHTHPHFCMLKSQEANVNPLGHHVPDSTSTSISAQFLRHKSI